MQKKNFYLIKLKFHFLNNKYICFYKQNSINLKTLCNKHNIGVIKLNYKYLNSLFKYKSKYLSFYILLYFNNFEKLLNIITKISIKHIYMLSYLGFFIQNSFIKKINNNFLFFNNNYKIYIFIIYTYINNYKNIIFIIILKIIYILNKIHLNLKKTFN